MYDRPIGLGQMPACQGSCGLLQSGARLLLRPTDAWGFWASPERAHHERSRDQPFPEHEQRHLHESDHRERCYRTAKDGRSGYTNPG